MIKMDKDNRYIMRSTARFVVLCLILGCFMFPAAVGAQTWNVSCVEGAYNYTTVSAIPGIGVGDIVRIWGVESYTYEAGITIDKPNVLIKRWEGSPTRPLITNTSQNAPAVTVMADNVTLQGLNISGNTLAGDGAAVYGNGTYDTRLQGFTITDCVFNGNAVTGNSYGGGAVYLEYVDNSKITDTVFESNSAGDCGGGLYFRLSDGVTLTDTSFESNSALFNGGAVYFYMTTNPTLTDTTFEYNTATSGGGAHFYNSASPTLTGLTFKNNEVVDNGGGAFFSDSENAHLTDTTFKNNVADTGNGVYASGPGSLRAVNCVFDNEENLYTTDSLDTVLNGTYGQGTNIAGGPYLGGNVWLGDPAQNISEWGVDADFDGICDEPLVIPGIGTDDYPLIYGSSVMVSSTPAGASIHVDSVKTALTTDDSFYLQLGVHTINVSLAGYVNPAEQIVVVGETASVSFTLVPVPTPTPTPAPVTHGSGGGRSDVSAGAACSLPAGGHASFGIQNSAIYEIEVTAGEKIPEILITVRKEALPPGMDAPVYAVYEYDEVTLYHTTDASIAGVTLYFGVTKAWLEEQGFAPEDVLLYRYHDNVWTPLQTSVSGEDTGKYYFTAESPGFSLFAIGAVEGDVPVAEATSRSEVEEIQTSEAEVAVIATPVEAEATETQQSPVPYGLAILATGMVYLLKKRQT